MRPVAVLLVLLCCAPAMSAEVYRWVDERGVTHWSDKPHPGAERITVQEPTTYEGRSLAPAAALPPALFGPQTGTPAAPRVAIVAPPNDTTYRAGSVSVTVQISVEGGVPPGQSVALKVNGQPAGAPGPSLTRTLDDLERGSHRLVAELLDGSGRVVSASPAVTFHVQKPSAIRRDAASGDGGAPDGGETTQPPAPIRRPLPLP